MRRFASGEGGAFGSFELGKVILHSQPSLIHSFPSFGFRVGQDILDVPGKTDVAKVVLVFLHT